MFSFSMFFGLSSYLTDNTIYIVSLKYASRRPHVARQLIQCSRLPYLTPFTEYGLGHCLTICFHLNVFRLPYIPRDADKALARPGRKQARKHVRNARDFNNIETRAVIKFFFFCKSRRRRKFMPF